MKEVVEKVRVKKIGMTLIIPVIMIVCLMTIGFAALNADAKVSGLVAEVKPSKDMRITDVSVEGISGEAEVGSIKFSKDKIYLNHSISVDATITYKIEITNFGNTEMGIYSIMSGETVVDSDDYTLGDKICDDTGSCTLGAKDYISITFDSTEVLLDEIVFEFREVFDVVYTNIDGNDYAKMVIKGGTLNVDFLENAPDFVDVYVAGVLLESDSYTYTDGVLTVEEVSGNVEVVKFLGISLSGR